MKKRWYIIIGFIGFAIGAVGTWIIMKRQGESQQQWMQLVIPITLKEIQNEKQVMPCEKCGYFTEFYLNENNEPWIEICENCGHKGHIKTYLS